MKLTILVYHLVVPGTYCYMSSYCKSVFGSTISGWITPKLELVIVQFGRLKLDGALDGDTTCELQPQVRGDERSQGRMKLAHS